MPPTQPVAGVKRKHSISNLEAIELDPHHDLTLIVGTPEHKDGQRVFRVNKVSMRHVSDIWSKMLTGKWAESTMAEVKFPDDSWKPFHIVLQVAHFQVHGLPDTLSFEELQALAALTDKYNLNQAIRMALDLKQWLHKQKHQWTNWPSLPRTQHYATMISVFQYDADFSYIASKLAVKFRFEDKHLYYGRSSSGTRLEATLPDRVLGKSQPDPSLPEHGEIATNYPHAEITKTRNHLLWGLIGCCKVAIANASKEDVEPPCGKAQCAALKLGTLVMSLTTAGLCPIPDDAKELHHSVASYWKAIHRTEYQAYDSCDQVRSDYVYTQVRPTSSTGRSLCKCVKGFGIIETSRKVFQEVLHADVYDHLQATSFRAEAS